MQKSHSLGGALVKTVSVEVPEGVYKDIVRTRQRYSLLEGEADFDERWYHCVASGRLQNDLAGKGVQKGTLRGFFDTVAFA